LLFFSPLFLCFIRLAPICKRAAMLLLESIVFNFLADHGSIASDFTLRG